MALCKVAGCRFRNSHTTAGHLCGNCGQYGHGRIECGNHQAIQMLRQHHNDRLHDDHHCELEGCKYPWSHTREAHHCHKCKRIHRSTQCIIQDIDVLQRQWRAHLDDRVVHLITTFLQQNPDKFVKFYVGMGCDIYFKAKGTSAEGIFMHSDSWGQYGPETSDRPIFDKFIGTLTFASDEFDRWVDQFDNPVVQIPHQDIVGGGSAAPSPTSVNKKCPLCRTVVKNVFDIKGSTDKCSVCLDANVEKFFQECSHAVTCKTCFDRL